MIDYLPYMVIMAGVTYLIRMLPLALFQKQITNIYIRSFLYYIPYAVLGCMTFPAIFSASGNVFASCVGCVVALYFSWRERSLIEVALWACVSAYLIDILPYLFH